MKTFALWIVWFAALTDAFGTRLAPARPLRTSALRVSTYDSATTPCPEVSLRPRLGNEMAIVACGWFWGPQPAYKALRGVTGCVVGYAGGMQAFPTYEHMMDHTEAVLVEYDPTEISYRQILQEWKRLGGTPYPSKAQYRSALFVLNDEQKDIARDYCANIDHVDVEKVTKFYRAEERHQDFLDRLG